MNKDFEYTSRKSRIAVILIGIIFLASVIMVPLIYESGHQVFIFGDASIAGIIIGLQFIYAVSMVLIDCRFGGSAALILLFVSLISTVYAVFVRHMSSALPGIFNCVAGIFAVLVIRAGSNALRRHACFDDLTGVSNRRHIFAYMDYLIEKKVPFHAIYLDLDHFKYINDTEGHERGDQVLKACIKLWDKIDKKSAGIGRLGGDEFIVIVPQSAVSENITDYAQKYIDASRNSLGPDNKNSLYMTCSAGTASYPEDGADSGDIIRKADIAMYFSKNNGRNMVYKYDESFEKTILKEQYIEGRIRDALKNDKFYMAYQPQYNAETKELYGYESLIRMKSDSPPPMFPAEFIPIAEKSDLIMQIGEFVLRSAMGDFAQVIKEHPKMLLSVNISAKQLLSDKFVQRVMDIVEETGFNAHNLEIEITEYCLLDYADEAISVINQIKEMGIKLAMDDFGTGYSSLSYLTKLPIDLIKIDKSIVDTMGNGEIVGAIASMGHALGCQIIAEGVEQERQLDILGERAVDLVQGYVWGKPMDFESAVRLLG